MGNVFATEPEPKPPCAPMSAVERERVREKVRGMSQDKKEALERKYLGRLTSGEQAPPSTVLPALFLK